MRSTARTCLIWGAAAAIIFLPAQARADGYVTPWIGANVASATDNGSRTLGVTTGYMGAGVFGFEADFGYSPDFFGSSDDVRRNSAITMMGDFILGVPIGGTHGAGVRPFVSGGVGMIRTQSERGTSDLLLSHNGFCYDLGSGMMGFFNQHIGLRGDVRYLRTLEDTNRGSGFNLDQGKLRYWRVSGGVTIR